MGRKMGGTGSARQASSVTANGRQKVQRLRVDIAAYSQAEEELDKLLETYVRDSWLVEIRSMRFGETLSYRYRLVLKPKAEPRALTRAVAEIEGVEKVVLVDDSETPSESE